MAEFVRGARVTPKQKPKPVTARDFSIGEVLFVLIEVARSQGIENVDDLVILTRRAWEAYRRASVNGT